MGRVFELPLKYSIQLSNVKGSATAKMFAEAKKIEKMGKDVYHLEIGQPDYLPPESVLEATSNFIRDGYTQYTISRGIAELRQEIANYYNNGYNARVDPSTESIVSAGAKLGIYATLWSVVNPGSNVVILNPSWVSYGDMTRSLGGLARYLPVDLDFNFNEDELRKLIDDNTVAVVLNSPSNPTGAVISRKGLELLLSIVKEYDIILISDEIYNEYVYDGKFTSLTELNDWKDNGVVVNGLSKTFSMTGYRIGYVLAKEETINSINKVMQLTISCPVSFNQKAGIVALQNIEVMRNKIHSIMPKRRELLNRLLFELDVDYKPPKGAIYGWFKIPGIDSISWANNLLATKNVAVTPGRAFGPAGEEHIRISFATSDEILTEGIRRIGEFIR